MGVAMGVVVRSYYYRFLHIPIYPSCICSFLQQLTFCSFFLIFSALVYVNFLQFYILNNYWRS